MDEVEIVVPSSSANVGLGYDIWCLGLENPNLVLTYTRIMRPGRFIEVEVESPFQPPSGQQLGYAGKLALKQFLERSRIDESAHLFYRDDGYAAGGLGRSGAEAVGAIIAAAVIYDIRLHRNASIKAAAIGEPKEHLDNVAGSNNGRFNIVVPYSPYNGKPSIDCYDVPEDLGLAIGFSSYQKAGGTEAGRMVLNDPVAIGDFVPQTGLISAATAALVTGNIDRFLELAWGDRFHQPRRARVGFYGGFDDNDFLQLQRRLYEEFGVAWNVSGAGPKMQAKYNKKDYPQGIVKTISPVVVPWFAERGIKMEIREMTIAKQGAHDYAQRNYNWNISP